MQLPIDADGAAEIALRSRGHAAHCQSPAAAGARLCAGARNGIDRPADAQAALTMLEVDAHGFDEIDRRLLLTIIEKYDGGPVGLGTLAATLAEEEDALEEVYEPFLIQIGFLDRTPRGRVATRLAYEQIAVLTDIYVTFPDWRMEIEDVAAIGDDIIVRMIVTGTHKGVGKIPVNGGLLVGVAPTGKSFKVQHIHWYTLKDGLIVEHRACLDDVGMRQELGLLPAVKRYDLPSK
jgi:predicted ester cyclase